MKAGLSVQDVTPPIGTYLAGYPNRNDPSHGVDDPLYLRVLALEDDHGQRLVLVTGDLLKLPRDMSWRLKRRAAARCGIASDRLVLNLSHTHASPGLFPQRCYPQWPVDVAYVCRFEQAVRDGVCGALADLRPAEVRSGTHEVDFGVSRRLPKPELGGRVVMEPNPDGVYDPALAMLTIYRGGQLDAVWYSHGCHPTSKHSLNISADWPGLIAKGLQRRLGDDVVVCFAQGAAGSVMPKYAERHGQEAYRAAWDQVAGQLASCASGSGQQPIDLNLESVETEFGLPYDLDWMPGDDALMEFASPEETPIPAPIRPANRSILRIWARDLLEQRRTSTVPTEFRMHAGRIRLADGLQMLYLSGEIVADVGLRLKSLFTEESTILLGYCSYTDAYIPTAAMLPEGGHEALGSIFFHERPAPFAPVIDSVLDNAIAGLTL